MQVIAGIKGWRESFGKVEAKSICVGILPFFVQYFPVFTREVALGASFGDLPTVGGRLL